MPQTLFPRVLLLGCSDCIPKGDSTPYDLMTFFLNELKIEAELDLRLYPDQDGKPFPPKLRAKILRDAFRNPKINAIFDLTGGDSANELLEYLNFKTIRNYPKPFFGYSDLSVLLNPLAQAGCPVYYFQARFLLESAACRENLRAVLQNPDQPVLTRYTFLQGEHLSGTLMGGNIRCTLKLMGTRWKPDFRDKILFLESNSGDLKRIRTMLWQYRQVSAFRRCCGVLLGNFTQIAEQGQLEALYAMVQEIVDHPTLPIVATTQVGHQPDSICLGYHVPLSLHRTEQTP